MYHTLIPDIYYHCRITKHQAWIRFPLIESSYTMLFLQESNFSSFSCLDLWNEMVTMRLKCWPSFYCSFTSLTNKHSNQRQIKPNAQFMGHRLYTFNHWQQIIWWKNLMKREFHQSVQFDGGGADTAPIRAVWYFVCVQTNPENQPWPFCHCFYFKNMHTPCPLTYCCVCHMQHLLFFFFMTACTDLYRCWRECMVSRRRESNLVDSICHSSDRTCATIASTHPSSQSPFPSCSGTPFHWRHLRLLCHALPAESCCCSCLWHSCWRGRKCCARSSKAVP